jgi:hypothetical protein
MTDLGRHPKIVEGDGSKDKPFVVNSNNPVSSALLENVKDVR